MTIQNILANKGKTVQSVTSKSTIKSAADRMHDKGISALVVSDGEAIRGIVTDRDLLHALSQNEKPPGDLLVEDAMGGVMVIVEPADSVTHAMKLMTKHRVRHVLVMSDDRLVGIVSIGDVVKNRLEDLETETNVLRDIYIAAH